MSNEYSKTVEFIKGTFASEKVFLHEPKFIGNEKKYLEDCLDTTFVSSVGKYVDLFEREVARFTGAKYAVATTNGTAALHIALQLSGVNAESEVILSPLTFVATSNAISYLNAYQIFIDIERSTLGLCPNELREFLKNNAQLSPEGTCINKNTGRTISACVAIHTFGHACKIDEIVSICQEYNIKVIEDAAESLGSYYKGKHTGTFGDFGAVSFNGNKIITTGGGGMILTNNEEKAKLAKHITTTAKISHKWEYRHDMIAYNYRLTNLAAALGVAQMEELPNFVERKRKLALKYKHFFEQLSIDFFQEPENSKSNYWLNCVLLENKAERNKFLEYTNDNGVMTRPVWELMNKLELFKQSGNQNLENAIYIADRLVNLPSSVIL